MTSQPDPQLVAAINEAMQQPTTYRDPSPLPPIGSTPPVPQPGRPPMSQRATDASALMLCAGAASLPIGGATSLVLYTLGHVDPAALAIGAVGPVALVLAIGALIRSAGRGLQGMHTENHFHGNVNQVDRSTSSETRGFFAKTINKK
ncbi:hypothetical protein OTB20_19415 [Streptomyces sp. H27-H1]|uniref:hypothetical protein n=1 Tax=Streptomyces sp. H27-H1 TaxID=2996461 RepID=UPI002271A9F0|nr:hypothetical protein [Streptomyces sp. H27-H1]MCY0928326.1 hypothetical protein [Streptomyces sp. H27-H1]